MNLIKDLKELGRDLYKDKDLAFGTLLFIILGFGLFVVFIFSLPLYLVGKVLNRWVKEDE